MKKLIALLFVLLIVSPLAAGDIPNAPAPKKERVFDWKFAAVASIPVLGYGLDYGTTNCSTQGHALPICPKGTISHLPQQRDCIETNPLLGPHPRTATTAAIAVGEIALADGVAYWLKKKGVKLWWLPPTLSGGSHLAFAGINISRGCY